MTPTPPRPTSIQAWMMAARPRTLPAAAAPVIVGSALAWSAGKFALLPALAALLGALLLQIGANLANDVFDFMKGADTHDRLGPVRVTQAGIFSPRTVIIAMGVTFALAALCGVFLIYHAGWPVVAIGLASIFTAVIYTGGPFPLGYNGLGEVAVFIFFGPVAVCGTYYVQAFELNLSVWLTSIAMGLLTVSILIVNNLRDIATDRASGKHTLAARFGEEWARREYIVVTSLAYLIPLVMFLTGVTRAWVLLSWASLPKFIDLSRSLYHTQGRALNRLLGETGQLELLFGVLFSLGLVLQVFLG